MYGPDDYDDEDMPIPPPPPDDLSKRFPYRHESDEYEGPDEPDDDGGFDGRIVNYPEGFREP